MGFFVHKTLRQKFNLIYILLIAGTLLVGVIAGVSLNHIGTRVSGIVERDFKNVQAVDEMLEIIDRQDSAVLTYLSIDEEKGIAIYTEGMSGFLTWLYVLEDSTGIDSGDSRVSSVRQNYDRYSKAFSLLQEQHTKRGGEAAVTYYNDTMFPMFEKIKDDLRTLRDEFTSLTVERKYQTGAEVQNLMVLILSVTLLMAGAGYVVSNRRVSRLLRPLYELTRQIKSVSKGGFNQHIDISSDGEIGELQEEFNNMVTRLKEYDESNIGRVLAEKNKLSTIIQIIEDPLLMVNDQFLVERVNPCAMRFFELGGGFTPRHILEITKNNDLFNLLCDCISQKSTRLERMIVFHPDTAVFNVIVTRFVDSSDGAPKLAVLMQNITSVTKTQKIRSDFIATASHELKTPLTTISMGASLLYSQDLGAMNPEQLEVVSAIRDDTGRLSSLVEDLLELSKIQSGNVSYQKRPVSLIKVTEKCLKHFGDRSKFSGVALKNDIPRDLPPLWADPEKLGWVFSNILNNAFKYTKKGDVITLSCQSAGRFLEVSVSDTGQGIPKELLQSIFECDFKYGDDDVECRGNGIGLTVSRKIIEAHGGSIRAQSTLGKGSSFLFTLPFYHEEDFK